jgi:hypothetical protein
VLGQSLTDFELLVMDDGSTDGSFEIIEHCAPETPASFMCGTTTTVGRLVCGE